MKSYLEGCRVPTVRIGDVEVPRLIAGLHPFDGYGYVSGERDDGNARHFSEFERIVEVLSYVTEEGIPFSQTDHMEGHLNRQHLVALWKASARTGIEIGTIPFLVVPITLDGSPLDSRRVYATFDKNAHERYGEAYRDYLMQDPIVQYIGRRQGGAEGFLIRFEEVPPYTADEMGRMAIDYAALEATLGFFEGFERLVADPGAEVDLLAPGGRIDLVEDYVAFLRKRFPAVVTSVHHPGITIPILERHGVPFDGYVTPLNKVGVFMLPTPQASLEAIRNCSKPVIAIKPMAGGRLLGQEAFDYVLNEAGAAACMFGLGRMDEVRSTVAAAKRAIGAG